MVDAMAADAMVNAPETLTELIGEAQEWSPNQLVELERAHMRAMDVVHSLAEEIHNDLKRRARPLEAPAAGAD